VATEATEAAATAAFLIIAFFFGCTMIPPTRRPKICSTFYDLLAKKQY
jgi:hypothetical protein